MSVASQQYIASFRGNWSSNHIKISIMTCLSDFFLDLKDIENVNVRDSLLLSMQLR